MPSAHRRSKRTPKYAGVEGVDAVVLRSGKSMRRTHRSTRRRPRPSLRAISPMELPPSKRALISSKGFVTETVAGQSSATKMVHDDLVCPPPVSPGDDAAGVRIAVEA